MITIQSHQLLQLIGFAILMAVGQILFKQTALTSSSMTSLNNTLSLTSNIWFWLAVIVYAASIFLWIYILQNINLSLAYPFASLGYLIVPVLALLIFKEPLSLRYILGALLIISGVLVISFSSIKY